MEAKPFSVMMIVAVMVIAVVGGGVAALSAAECKQEIDLGKQACQAVVYGKLPSPECCQRIRVTHFECVCPIITPDIAALIDIKRTVRLIEGCGRRVPRHYKCGSITTP